MDGTLHVIEQVGLAHKHAVEVIAQQAQIIADQAARIAELEAAQTVAPGDPRPG